MKWRRWKFAWIMVAFFCQTVCARAQQVPPVADRLDAIRGEMRRLVDDQTDDPNLARRLEAEWDAALTSTGNQLDPEGQYQLATRQRFQRECATVEAWLAEPSSATAAMKNAWQERLRRLRESWQDGTVYLASSEETLVQWLHAAKRPLPSAPARQDGRTLVQLEVGELTQPTVLALSSYDATAWSLEVPPDSRIEAILLLNHADVLQCEASVPIFRRQGGYRHLSPEANRHTASLIEYETGRQVDVLIPIFAADRLHVLGPSDASWTRAMVMRQVLQLKNDIRIHRNRDFFDSHTDLQFPGMIVDERGFTRSNQAAIFDLTGPVSIQHLPAGASLWNHVILKETQSFALLHAGSLSEWSEDSERWILLPGPSQHFGGTVFRALCADTRRQRLVLLDTDGVLFSYDPATRKWTVLRRGLQNVVAITYDAENDSLVGVQQSEQPVFGHAATQETIILGLDPTTGEIQYQQETNCTQSLSGPYRRVASELSVTDDYLIAVQPPGGAPDHWPPRSKIYVLHRKSGELLYEYMPPPIAGQDIRSGSFNKPNHPTRYAAFQERLQIARMGVQKLRTSDSSLATDLAKRLNAAASPVDFASIDPEQPTLYWLYTYAGASPTVKIDKHPGPVIVAVSSFGVDRWHLDVDDEVNLQQLLFVGGDHPEIRGLPAGVPFQERNFSEEEQQENNARQPDHLQSVVEKLAGRRVTQTVDLRRNAGRSVISISPQNGDLAVAAVLKELNEIIRITTQRRQRDLRLPESFRFAYLYQGDLPMLESRGEPVVVECNFKGPILQTAGVLEPSAAIQSVVRTGPLAYLASDLELGLVRLEALDGLLHASPVAPAMDTDRLHGMMLDPSRDQLMGFSSRGLHVRTRGQWKTVRTYGRPWFATCRDSERDLVYGVVRENQEIVAIDHMAMNGRTVEIRKLPVPIPCSYAPNRRTGFAFCDGNFVILVLRKQGGRDADSNQVYVLDRETLKILHQGSFRPHFEYQRYTDAEFSRLWDQLTVTDEIAVGAATRALISGLADSSERIKQRLGIAESIPRAEVDRLVLQLDAERFVQREQAQQTLRERAKPHADYLRQLLEEKLQPVVDASQQEPRRALSAEQRSRLQMLLALWQDSTVRVERAQKILERIEVELANRP